MRFHWGLAIGHLYSKVQTQIVEPTVCEAQAIAASNIAANDGTDHATMDLRPNGLQVVHDHEIVQAEFGLDNCEDDEWEDDSGDLGDDLGFDDNGWEAESDDEVIDALHEMYRPEQF